MDGDCDGDLIPAHVNKKRKSDDRSDEDPNGPETSSSHSLDNTANSSSSGEPVEVSENVEIPAESEEIRAESEEIPAAGISEGDVDMDPETEPELEADVVFSFDQFHFQGRGRRAAGRRRYTNQSSAGHSTSSTSSELDNERTSSDSNVNIGSQFELSSITSVESDAHFFDDYPSSEEEATPTQSETEQCVVNILGKEKPTYNWIGPREIVNREHGLTSCGRLTLRNPSGSSFSSSFYSSRHVVEKMKLLHTMHKHTGCVNSLNFNRSGDLLCSGSDDQRVVVWDWAANKVKFCYKSGHSENIFQTKFIDVNGGMEIISTSRDGQVRAATVMPNTGKIRTRTLYKHIGAVHKLVLCPQNPFIIYSAGEDSKIMCYDMRKSQEQRMLTVKEARRRVPLYSIAHHPLDAEICVCGNDNFVRVFDKRNMSEPLHKMSPQRLADKAILPHITCCVYNSSGTEILASYSDDDIYLFSNKNYTPGSYLHSYKGHYNHKTIKGVNFFGPNSEYVISGSDCGNIFFWDKETEAIINFMEGDNFGVVNCLESHPAIPILATSGLDNNIKIWAPNSETYPPDMNKLDKCIKRNLRRSVVEEVNGFNGRQFVYFMRQFLRNPRPSDNNDSSVNDDQYLQLSNSSDSDDDYRIPNERVMRRFRPSCSPQ